MLPSPPLTTQQLHAVRGRSDSVLHAPQPQLRPPASLRGAGGVEISCMGNKGLHPTSTEPHRGRKRATRPWGPMPALTPQSPHSFGAFPPGLVMKSLHGSDPMVGMWAQHCRALTCLRHSRVGHINEGHSLQPGQEGVVCCQNRTRSAPCPQSCLKSCQKAGGVGGKRREEERDGDGPKDAGVN